MEQPSIVPAEKTLIPDPRPFRERHPLERRKEEALRITRRYPDRIPVIVEGAPEAPPIDKNKFLVPRELSGAELQVVIRKRIRLPADQALFFFVAKPHSKGVLLSASQPMGVIYKEYQDPDGFLYIRYQNESTFG